MARGGEGLPRQKRLRGAEPLHRQEAGAPDRQGAQRQQKHTEKVIQGITLTGLAIVKILKNEYFCIVI